MIVTYILLLPIVIYINTVTNEYFVQLKGLMKINIEEDKNELICIRMRIFFMNFMFYPLKISSLKTNGFQKRKNKQIGLGFKYFYRILSSFRVRQFLLQMDTGNFIMNAKLYPVFYVLNQRYGGFQINFEGNNQLVLQIQNRPICIIKSIINF